jgi:hydroxyacylglutathione hydrolase
VGAERATNPFVRANLPHVMASASAHAGRAIDEPVESLAVLREWKDHFA